MLHDRDYMREGRSRFEPQWTVTLTIIVINIAVFVVQNLERPVDPDSIYNNFALSLDGLKHGHIWQLITFQFLHAPLANGGIFHILGNLFTIYVFGNAVEEAIGKMGFLKLYLLGGTFGGLLQMLGGFVMPSHFGQAVVGASAGAFALVAAFATLFPHRPLQMFFLPIEIKAHVLLWLSIGAALLGMVSSTSHVAHCAHLGGILTGIIYIRYITYSQKPLVMWQPFRPKARRELVTAGSGQPKLWRRPKEVKPEDLPSEEFISKEVDPILEKISAHGIQSLTERERQILQMARSKMSKH